MSADREVLRQWIVFYADAAERKSRSFSGADRTDSVRDQFTAAALRRVLTGEFTPAAAVEWFRGQWKEFQRVRNAKVKDATKIKYGPSSGQSSIEYMVATDANGEQGELNITQTCSRAGYIENPGNSP
jgi:hypothetical protein